MAKEPRWKTAKVLNPFSDLSNNQDLSCSVHEWCDLHCDPTREVAARAFDISWALSSGSESCSRHESDDAESDDGISSKDSDNEGVTDSCAREEEKILVVVGAEDSGSDNLDADSSHSEGGVDDIAEDESGHVGGDGRQAWISRSPSTRSLRFTMGRPFNPDGIYVPERDKPTTIPDSAPAFTYDALPIHKFVKYIRLLKIKPAIFLADVLDCELIVAPIDPNHSDSAPPFDALSYAWSLDERPYQQQHWAPRTGPKEILVNGKRLLAQESLASAMHRYRRLGCSYLRRGKGPWKGKAEYLWADAICIDQSNIPEKTSQVAMMDEIYRRARRVFIDLGVVRDDWISALCLMETIRSITNLMPHPRRPALLNEKTILEVLELPPVDHMAWKALGHTLEMPWFRRTWVVQEIVLPNREPVAMFGRYCFGLHMFFNALDFIRSQGYHNALTAHAPARNTGLLNAAKMGGIRKHYQRGSLFSVALLENIRDFAASDPRDKVFGVLSLMPENERILPDYSLTVDEVYTRFAKTIVLAGYGPRLLDTAGLQRRTAEDPLTRTWVPDWRA